MTKILDIENIIKLVKEQEPEREDIILALLNCKDGYWSDKSYYRFVNSNNSNEYGSEWQHKECIVIEQVDKGDIVIDLLQDGRIGGMEFTDLINK